MVATLRLPPLIWTVPLPAESPNVRVEQVLPLCVIEAVPPSSISAVSTEPGIALFQFEAVDQAPDETCQVCVAAEATAEAKTTVQKASRRAIARGYLRTARFSKPCHPADS